MLKYVFYPFMMLCLLAACAGLDIGNDDDDNEEPSPPIYEDGVYDEITGIEYRKTVYGTYHIPQEEPSFSDATLIISLSGADPSLPDDYGFLEDRVRFNVSHTKGIETVISFEVAIEELLDFSFWYYMRGSLYLSMPDDDERDYSYQCLEGLDFCSVITNEVNEVTMRAIKLGTYQNDEMEE